MEDGVHERILSFLRENGVSFREIHHKPTRTSEESARVRGEELKNGGKAKVNDATSIEGDNDAGGDDVPSKEYSNRYFASFYPSATIKYFLGTINLL